MAPNLIHQLHALGTREHAQQQQQPVGSRPSLDPVCAREPRSFDSYIHEAREAMSNDHDHDVVMEDTALARVSCPRTSIHPPRAAPAAARAGSHRHRGMLARLPAHLWRHCCSTPCSTLPIRLPKGLPPGSRRLLALSTAPGHRPKVPETTGPDVPGRLSPAADQARRTRGLERGAAGGRSSLPPGIVPLSTGQRRPTLWDKVILAPGVPDTRGLRQGVIATVIKLHPKSRPDFYFRVEIPDCHGQPWLGIDELTLQNPEAPLPKPREPAPNECCGAECPNCVWIQYWDARAEFERERQHESAGRSLPDLTKAIMRTRDVQRRYVRDGCRRAKRLLGGILIGVKWLLFFLRGFVS